MILSCFKNMRGQFKITKVTYYLNYNRRFFKQEGAETSHLEQRSSCLTQQRYARQHYPSDCSIYSSLSELMPHLGLFLFRWTTVIFTAHSSENENWPLVGPSDYSFSFFLCNLPGSLLLLFPLKTLHSSSLLCNDFILPLLHCSEYIFHLLSILLILFFFFSSVTLQDLLPAVSTDYNSSIYFFKI